MLRSRRLWRLWVVLGMGVVACQPNERRRTASATADLQAQPDAALVPATTETAAIAPDVPELPPEVLGEETAVAPAVPFTEPPPLVPVEPQVYVVEDYDVPVYYTDGHYWVQRDETWYHTPRWDQPWVVVDVSFVPALIVHKQHERYVRYRDPVATVWHEPRHYRNLPEVFYEPPPLISIDAGVYVVENYHAPVYYADGHYWQHRQDRWYRASRYDEPWHVADLLTVPTKIRGRDHDHYVRYRRSDRSTVWQEPRLPWRSFDKKLERERREDREAREARRERAREQRQARDRDRRDGRDRPRYTEHLRDRAEDRREAERRRERREAEQRRERAAEQRREKERKGVEVRRDRTEERAEAERRRDRAREVERSRGDNVRKTKARDRDAPKVKVKPRKTEAAPSKPSTRSREVLPWKVEKTKPRKAPETKRKVQSPATPPWKVPAKKAAPPQRDR